MPQSVHDKRLKCQRGTNLPLRPASPRTLLLPGALPVLLFALLQPSASRAQGSLVVTPGRATNTVAGSGTRGYGGDGSAATSAQLARPSGVAYDSAGDLFFADSNNHVVREITPAGVITTVAGNGTAGFGGDNGPATAAFLDTPASVAVDTSGTVYIADSHNHRIRKVSQGVISTIAGIGTSGYSGDGGPATNTQLALPSGIALDHVGNLYVADTNNHRIRKITGGTISTVAGNGEELFAGDGGPATAASLDQPTGVTVDAANNLYIADKNNQRIRVVSSAGVISTLAGNGAGDFAGGFSGDGSTSIGASLARPVSVAVDASGNVYIADSDNQRIRQISSNGVISTVLGSGNQGFAGDGGAASTAVLNSPLGLASDSVGNLVIADTRNQRLRSGALGQLTFGTQAIGTVSATQTVTLANTGTAPLTLAAPTATGPFQVVAGGSCSSMLITLAPGASCTEEVAFTPSVAGQGTGTLAVAGQGLATQSILLSGSGVGTPNVPTTLVLSADKIVALTGETITLSAALNATTGPASSAPGTVSFFEGSQLLGTLALTHGKATLAINSLLNGQHTLTATYSGGTGFTNATSSALVENIADLSFAAAAMQAVSVVPGSSANAPLYLQGTGAAGLSGTVILAAPEVPPGVSISFSPATAAFVNGQMPFSMKVSAAQTGTFTASIGGASLLGLIVAVVLPAILRNKGRRLPSSRGLAIMFLSLGTAILLGATTGCGSNTGFFAQRQQSYNVTVKATVTDTTGGTLTRDIAVPVIVQ